MRFCANGETARFIDNKVGYLLHAPWERVNKNALDVSGSVHLFSRLSSPYSMELGCPILRSVTCPEQERRSLVLLQYNTL